MSTLAPRPEPAAPPAPLPPFEVGARVRWHEGRTRRECVGVVQAVQVLAGWDDAPEYDVQLVTKKGKPGRTVRRWHSQLEPAL